MSNGCAPTRRTFLLAGAGALAVPGIAACGASAPQAGPADEPATGAGDRTPLTTLADLPPGTTVVVEPGPGDGVAVVRDDAGDVHGLSAVCTHQGCLVAARDVELVCPCHGSRFSAADGAVLAGPATRPLPAVELRIEGDDVVLG